MSNGRFFTNPGEVNLLKSMEVNALAEALVDSAENDPIPATNKSVLGVKAVYELLVNMNNRGKATRLLKELVEICGQCQVTEMCSLVAFYDFFDVGIDPEGQETFKAFVKKVLGVNLNPIQGATNSVDGAVKAGKEALKNAVSGVPGLKDLLDDLLE